MTPVTHDSAAVGAVIARTHREEWSRIVAGLARRYGDLDLAEEMAAEAFATATERWPADGVPPNPGAWITTTAHRRAIDRLRREARRDEKQREALMLAERDAPEPVGAVDDDRLRLVFVCCHPVLPLEARVALTLRMLGGLTVQEIAHAFLVQEGAMGQRITRAKARIKAAGVAYRVPDRADLPHRVDGVLAVLYLIFNEGYLASGADVAPIRRDLTREAIRLTRLVHALLPDDDEVVGLLALMLLTEARADARLSSDGELVRLDEQDRGRWDTRLVGEGLALLGGEAEDAAHDRRAAGRYRLLAEINAVHVRAPRASDTDWSRIAALYGLLERIDPSPGVALGKAIAIAEFDSPQVGLAMVDRLTDALGGRAEFHATRAELLRSDGRTAQALAAYDRAIDLADNTAEVQHLTRRRNQLTPPGEDRHPTEQREKETP